MVKSSQVLVGYTASHPSKPKVRYLSYFSSTFSNSLVEFSFSSINFWLAYNALSSFSFRISISV